MPDFQLSVLVKLKYCRAWCLCTYTVDYKSNVAVIVNFKIH